MIRAILFDIDNTLLDFHKCAQASIKRGFEEWGISFTDKTYSIYQSINNPLWRQIEDGKITLEELKRIRWVKVFAALDIQADGVKFEHVFRKNLKELAEPVDGADEILEYLHPNYQMYSASNGPYLQQLHRLELANMSKYMRGNFISEDVGFQKPTKGFFEVCFREIQQSIPNIQKEEVLMVGDSLTADIKGGVDYEIQTCWYNHNQENHSLGKDADYVIDNLLELKKFL